MLKIINGIENIMKKVNKKFWKELIQLFPLEYLTIMG
jgi:hypothetical protein